MSTLCTTSLDQAVHWTVRFDRGQVIYDEGEPAECVYRVDTGCVRLQVNGPEGERQIVAFLFPGDLFGFCPVRRNSAAEAVSDITLSRFPTHAVFDSERFHDVTVELVRRATEDFGELAHLVHKISHLSAADRVLWFFHWMARRDSTAHDEIRLPMSQRDVADYLALKPETLSRAFADLEHRGLLVRNGRRRFTIGRPVQRLQRLQAAFSPPP